MVARAAAALLLAAAGAAAPAPSARHYRIDTEGSELRWELPATLHTVEGRAPRLSGTIDLQRGPISKSEPNVEPWHGRVRVVVDARAMATGNSSRDRKMREVTLEAPRFPDIVFESRRIEADLSRFRPGEHLTAEVAGELTIHGRTAALRLPVDVFVEADHVILAGGFSIGWKQFGLPDPSFGIITVREPVRVTFRLRAVPVRRKR